jgi:hypothetical protein
MAASSFCDKCKNKVCLATKVPCKAVEKILKKVTTGRRNWQTPIEPFVLEKLAAKMDMKAKYGRKWSNRVDDMD